MDDVASIVIAGQPAWSAVLDTPEGFQLLHYGKSRGMVSKLVNDRAALVLVDGLHPAWTAFTVAPKQNAATRRLGVIVVAMDQNVRKSAPKHGADLAIMPDALIANFSTIVANYAHVPSKAETVALLTMCEGTLPPLAQAGVEKFNNREFYAQHDLFEELWMQTDGSVRNLYQAILQVGIAYYQIERGNYPGARKMLLRAAPWLEMLPDACQGVDVAQLRQDAYHVRDVLARMSPEKIGDFDLTLLKPIHMI